MHVEKYNTPNCDEKHETQSIVGTEVILRLIYHLQVLRIPTHSLSKLPLGFSNLPVFSAGRRSPQVLSLCVCEAVTLTSQ